MSVEYAARLRRRSRRTSKLPLALVSALERELDKDAPAAWVGKMLRNPNFQRKAKAMGLRLDPSLADPLPSAPSTVSADKPTYQPSTSAMATRVRALQVDVEAQRARLRLAQSQGK